jgi:hypothetical protein
MLIISFGFVVFFALIIAVLARESQKTARNRFRLTRIVEIVNRNAVLREQAAVLQDMKHAREKYLSKKILLILPRITNPILADICQDIAENIINEYRENIVLMTSNISIKSANVVPFDTSFQADDYRRVIDFATLISCLSLCDIDSDIFTVLVQAGLDPEEYCVKRRRDNMKKVVIH